MCFAQEHNTAEVGIEPPTSRFGVLDSSTEPPCSLAAILDASFEMFVMGNQNAKITTEFNFVYQNPYTYKYRHTVSPHSMILKFCNSISIFNMAAILDLCKFKELTSLAFFWKQT